MTEKKEKNFLHKSALEIYRRILPGTIIENSITDVADKLGVPHH